MARKPNEKNRAKVDKKPTPPTSTQQNKKMTLTMPDGTQYIFEEDLEEKKPRKVGMDAIKQMREYVQRKGSRYKFQKVKKN